MPAPQSHRYMVSVSLLQWCFLFTRPLSSDHNVPALLQFLVNAHLFNSWWIALNGVYASYCCLLCASSNSLRKVCFCGQSPATSWHTMCLLMGQSCWVITLQAWAPLQHNPTFFVVSPLAGRPVYSFYEEVGQDKAQTNTRSWNKTEKKGKFNWFATYSARQEVRKQAKRKSQIYFISNQPCRGGPTVAANTSHFRSRIALWSQGIV